jgi:hypothetical protein
MYVETSRRTRGGTTYTRHLLRASYRAHAKVLHRTRAQVSHGSEAELAALRLALRHQEDLAPLGPIQAASTLQPGGSCGAVWTLSHVARRLGIAKALGTTRAGTLALWPVMARGIDQGSRPCVWRWRRLPGPCWAEPRVLRRRSTRTWRGWRGPTPRARIGSWCRAPRPHQAACVCLRSRGAPGKGRTPPWRPLARIALAHKGSCRWSSAYSATRRGSRSPAQGFPAIATLRRPGRRRLPSARAGWASTRCPSLVTAV